MRIDNKTLEGRCVCRCESREIFGRRISYCVCWLLTAVCWLWSDFSLAATSSVQPASTESLVIRGSETRQDAEARSIALWVDSSLKHQLWRALISVPNSKEDAGAKRELGQLIKQIGSVEFKAQREHSEMAGFEPASKTEPNGTAEGGRTLEAAAEKQIESRPADKRIREQTLLVVEQLCKQPEQVENPCELGEVLFLSGNVKEAATFYEEALNRSSADDAASAHQRAWILYQLGNCLRHDDMPKARQIYRQLIEQYPDSLWSTSAKAQEQLIGWYLSEKPETLTEGDILQEEQPTAASGRSTE
ncbi:MAG: tetratricopeptide repeat protein [Planctomycetota bacterium]